jgi:hypothetical protein
MFGFSSSTEILLAFLSDPSIDERIEGKQALAELVELALEGSRRVNRAFGYLQGHKAQLGIASVFDSTDKHIEVIDLLGNRVEVNNGTVFLVSLVSALRSTSPPRDKHRLRRYGLVNYREWRKPGGVKRGRGRGRLHRGGDIPRAVDPADRPDPLYSGGWGVAACPLSADAGGPLSVAAAGSPSAVSAGGSGKRDTR